MLEVSDSKVAAWGRGIGVGDRRLAELDFRLVDLLARYGRDPELQARTAFKGGTALNKLYLGSAARLSVDLDLNAIGTKDDVQGARRLLRDHMMNLFRAQDPAFVLKHDHSWEMLRVTGEYAPLAGGAKEKVKIETSMAERVPILGTVERPLETPEGSARIRTYNVDELLATKWRAFYSRSKGRDLFDLATARPLVGNPDLLRKMALYYFLHNGIEYDPIRIRESIAEKSRNRAFAEDLRVYLRGDVRFDAKKELGAMHRSYGFMFKPDPIDREFLLLSRHLLGKMGTARAGSLVTEKTPLRALFEGFNVSAAILDTPRQELVPFKKR